MRNSGFFNVWLLAASNSLAFSATPLMMLVGSLLGAELAPSADWATLPIATMVVGAAVGILPATQTMRYLGRKRGFLVFVALGAITCLLASYALVERSFMGFCLSSSLLGFTNAALQQMRFAGMESVEPEKSPTAASIVMCGGIIAAILGPELAVAGQHFTEVEYQGSFWLVGVCFLMAGALLCLLKNPRVIEVTTVSKKSRPLGQMLQSPSFLLAVISGTVGFVVMTFVMTGTPISMHNHQGHSLADTKWVIQSHIAAMFLPSLVTPLLFRWFRIQGLMVAGIVCYSLMIFIGMMDSTVMGYWYQLIALGVGWNFLFVSGTALLPSTHLPGEQYKAQSFNDMTVFSFQAVASLTAGWAINITSWQNILLVCLVPMILLTLVLIWNQLTRKTA